MYAALNESGKLLYASDLQKNRNQKWYCPDCGERVQLSESSKGKLFFKHFPKNTKYTGGESTEHLNVKEELIEFFQQKDLRVDKEVMFSSIDRIADIVIIDYGLIIEIQHTPITSQEIRERTLAYNHLGFKCIWLMTSSVNMLTQKHQWQQILMQYSGNLGYFRVIYDKGIKVQWGFQIVNSKAYSYFEFSGDGGILLNFDEFTIMKNSIEYTRTIGTTLKNFDKRILSLKKSRNHRDYILKLYELGVRLDDVPQWILMERYLILGVKTLPWMVLVMIWVRTEQNDERIDDIVEELVRKGEIRCVELPFIKTTRWIEDLSQGIRDLFNRNKAG